MTTAFPLPAGFITMSLRAMSFWRASLSCLERLSAIFDGLVLRMSLLSNCMKSSNPRSRSLFGVHEFFFLKGFGSET